MKINRDLKWEKYRTIGRLQGKLDSKSGFNHSHGCGLRLQERYNKYDDDENESTEGLISQVLFIGS